MAHFTQMQKAVKALYSPQTGFASADKVIAKQDGTVELSRSYYYHTMSVQEWVKEVTSELERGDIEFGWVSGRDDNRSWPKESYLVAVVHPVDL